ncbi:penicillin-binding protein [Rhizocola hellebori]|uniref:penicillin-binding protein n=1 Tax=Rhizocola hellebori TaxID=1392758 RepID=UPI001EF28F80|nr:transglycosylase domain-containing protein [Rhizocola hellebori]
MGRLSTLALCAVLAGIVVAAAAFPVAAISGLLAKAGGEAFGQLPDELTVKRSPQISYVFASDNTTQLAAVYDENRRDLPLAEIPDVVQQAILAAEDQKFYDHNGVDVKGFARAFIANQSQGEVQQGASTITMQLVRMSLTYSLDTKAQEVLAATEDTNARKLREIRYAIALERRMNKQQILENYLNTAFFGNRAFGIFAASQVYFDKHPKDLTVSQAAYLAGLVKFPSSTDDEKGKRAALERRDYIVTEMANLKKISPEQAAAAKAEKLVILYKKTPNGCVDVSANHWGFFCDYLHRWWLQQEVFGPTTYDRERQLRAGGFRIQSTLDLTTQTAAYNAAIKQAPINLPQALLLAGIEPGTGKVRALAANRNFKLDDDEENGPNTNPKAPAGSKGSYPNTTNPLLSTDPSFQGYRPGSVMKIYTLVAALENGIPLDYVINTQAQAQSKYPYKLEPTCNGMWCPPNSAGTAIGPHNMWTAFGSSVNTYFVPLFDTVGGDKVIDVAKRMGVTFYDVPDDPNDRPGTGTKDDDFYSSVANAKIWSPFTLGISTHPPLQIANTFATLAADGLYCAPTPIEAIFTFKNEKLDIGGKNCTQVIDPEVARAAIDAARCPVGDSSTVSKCQGGTALDSRKIIGKPVAGKSGTSDNESTATLTITTKQLAISGFLVDPDWPDTTQKMKHKGDRGINPAVQMAMRDAMAGKPSIQFTPPKNQKLITGVQANIPVFAPCASVGDVTAALKGAGFRVEVAKGTVPSVCPAGSVAATNPTVKTLRGGLVVIQVSDGKGPSPGP